MPRRCKHDIQQMLNLLGCLCFTNLYVRVTSTNNITWILVVMKLLILEKLHYDVKEIKNWHGISIIMWNFCSFEMDLVENENL